MELPALPDPLPMPVVDSHCHLDSTQALSGLEPDEAIRLAAEVGVTRIVQIGCDPDGCRWAVKSSSLCVLMSTRWCRRIIWCNKSMVGWT